MTFIEKLTAVMERSHSWVCVGLDVNPALFPPTLAESDDCIFTFNKAIVDATADLVCAYKPNLAFYLALGLDGLSALERTLGYIPERIPVILDAKVGDVGHTAEAYAKAAFETWGFDALTVNPYLGSDAIRPFEKMVFILSRTSNPSAGEFQLVTCDGKPLYQIVARQARELNRRGNCGLVVGATYPKELRAIRSLAPELVFLIPGIGAQGGDLEAAVTYGVTAEGIGPIINSSRGIIYASSGSDFAVAARRAALDLRRRINELR